MRTAAPVLAVAALLALAGCSSAPATPTPFGVPTAANGATAAPAASPTSVVLTPAEVEMYGPRVELGGGLILKQLGKVVQYGGPDDQDNNTFGARFIVDKIAVDPKCDPYMTRPDRGHRLVLSMRVETGAVFDQTKDGTPQYYQWSTIAPDGITQGPPTSSQDCHSAAALPQEFRASAKYRGEVTVETSNVAGQLVFANFAVLKYPA